MPAHLFFFVGILMYIMYCYVEKRMVIIFCWLHRKKAVHVSTLLEMQKGEGEHQIWFSDKTLKNAFNSPQY